MFLSINNPLIVDIDFDPINEWDNNYKTILKDANIGGNDGIIIKAEKYENMFIPFKSNQIHIIK